MWSSTALGNDFKGRGLNVLAREYQCGDDPAPNIIPTAAGSLGPETTSQKEPLVIQSGWTFGSDILVKMHEKMFTDKHSSVY